MDNAQILVMAPTGRAAIGAKGVTLHSKEGLSLPTTNISSKEKNSLNSLSLARFQHKMENIIGILVDEFSMIHQTNFAWIDIRLREAFPTKSNLPFGGCPIAFCGDPGQIPPVGGLSMWCNKTSKGGPLRGLAKSGYDLWMGIKTVIKLTQPVRQTNNTEEGKWFGEMLLRLRDGQCINTDWERLNQKCAQQNIPQARIDAFNSPSTIWLFNTNKDNTNHNKKMISILNQPILRINARHDQSPKSKEKSSSFTRNLLPFIYVAKGAKVMLWWNINSSVGLVNGSTGIVIDWIFEQGTKPPDLPAVIIIEFDDYHGPPFFSEPNRAKWVPILPEKYQWPSNTLEEDTHFREQFPISLAWGLTVWKSQGMTIKSPLAYDLGKSEPEAGLTYVACSRMTNVNNLYIDKGCSKERLTTVISKNKKMVMRLAEDKRQEELHKTTNQLFIN